MSEKAPLHNSSGYISHGYRTFAWCVSLLPGLAFLVFALFTGVPKLWSAALISGVWFLFSITGFLVLGRSYMYVRDSEWEEDAHSLANAPRWLRIGSWLYSVLTGIFAAISVSSATWYIAIPVGLMQFGLNIVFLHFFGFRIWLLFKKVFSRGK